MSDESISRSSLLRILRAAQHHTIASEQRMQQIVVNRYNCFSHTSSCYISVETLMAWQQGKELTPSHKLKSKDDYWTFWCQQASTVLITDVLLSVLSWERLHWCRPMLLWICYALETGWLFSHSFSWLLTLFPLCHGTYMSTACDAAEAKCLCGLLISVLPYMCRHEFLGCSLTLLGLLDSRTVVLCVFAGPSSF